MNDLQSTSRASCSIYLFFLHQLGYLLLDGLENHFCLAWGSICLCVVVSIHKSENSQCFSMLFPRLMTQFFVFAEFCREVSDIQMPHVAPLILPEMYKIFVHADVRLKNK